MDEQVIIIFVGIKIISTARVEVELDSIRKSSTRGGAPFDDEHDERHRKLAAHQISIQAVALECKRCVLVSDVGVAVSL
eukprot:scaffold3769_cov57-Cyclotella_meneghiniana.AAC.7